MDVTKDTTIPVVKERYGCKPVFIGRPVRLVDCENCKRYRYFGSTIHTPLYCTSYESEFFDYRGVGEIIASYKIKKTSLNVPTYEKNMSFFNFTIKK